MHRTVELLCLLPDIICTRSKFDDNITILHPDVYAYERNN